MQYAKALNREFRESQPPYKRISESVRIQILARDKYTCRDIRCPNPKPLREHLVVHDTTFSGQHEFSEKLVTLCRGCHNRETAAHYKAYRQHRLLYLNIPKKDLRQIKMNFEGLRGTR